MNDLLHKEVMVLFRQIINPYESKRSNLFDIRNHKA